MVTATLTSKGQITIPLEVRRQLNLEQGDRVEFVPRGKGFLIQASTHSVHRLAGFFGAHQGEPVTIGQMNEDIASEAAGVK